MVVYTKKFFIHNINSSCSYSFYSYINNNTKMFNWHVLLNVFYIPASYSSSIRFSTHSLFFLELITISIWSLRHFLILHNESFIKISLSLYTLGTCVRSVISSWYTFAFLPVLVS